MMSPGSPSFSVTTICFAWGRVFPEASSSVAQRRVPIIHPVVVVEVVVVGIKDIRIATTIAAEEVEADMDVTTTMEIVGGMMNR